MTWSSLVSGRFSGTNIIQTSGAVAIVAGFICLLVFLRALSCDFVNFDDHESILENVAIKALDSRLIIGAFSTSMFGFWMPLTWISYAVDYHFWGLNPLGYHLTNILLHALNTGLVVLLADRVMSLWQGSRVEGQGASRITWYRVQDECLYPATLLLVGLLWGIHPLRVESVVWVTERKDVLNGFFALSSVLAYLRYAARKESGEAVWLCYLLSLFLFVCSLMAKPVTVVLPVMLLVLDWYPLGRLRRAAIVPLLVEKLPFLVFSMALSLLTLKTAVEKDMLMAVDRLAIGERFLVSGNAMFEYLRLFMLPFGILPLHSLPNPVPATFIATSVVSLLVICCVVFLARRFVAVPVVFLLFLLPLVPVLGFLQNGQQAFAARYTYLPHIALSIAVAVLVLRMSRITGGSRSWSVMIAFTLVVVVLAGMTRHQIGVWENSGTLWTRVIEHDPVSTAYKSRGSYYLLTGRYDQAVSDYTAAMESAVGQDKRELYNLLAGRAAALGSMGRYEESIRDFTAAIDLYPHPSYFYSRGITLQAMGRKQEAQMDLRRAGPDPGPIKWFVYGKGFDQ